MIQEFWDWFTKKHLSLRKIMDGDFDLIDSILIELKKIESGLAVEFEENEENILMTISANGVKENFEIVKRIVQSSPKIQGWKFVAFRQPLNEDKVENLSITVKGYEINSKYLQFIPIEEEGKLYILIFSDKITDENRNDIGYACFLILDNLIGEYDCVTKVNGYEFYNFYQPDYNQAQAKPLTKIRDFIDKISSKV